MDNKTMQISRAKNVPLKALADTTRVRCLSYGTHALVLIEAKHWCNELERKDGERHTVGIPQEGRGKRYCRFTRL